MIGYPPSIHPVQDKNGQITVPWKAFMDQVFYICQGISSSGPSNQRPTKLLYVGRSFFDTDLGKPIWIRQVSPVIWVTSDGNPI